MEEKILVDTKFLMDRYKVTKQAISLWVKAGMPHYRMGYRTLRYDLNEVEQYFRDKAKNPGRK